MIKRSFFFSACHFDLRVRQLLVGTEKCFPLQSSRVAVSWSERKRDDCTKSLLTWAALLRSSHAESGEGGTIHAGGIRKIGEH